MQAARAAQRLKAMANGINGAHSCVIGVPKLIDSIHTASGLPEVYIVGAARTAVGLFQGGLKVRFHSHLPDA